jgi:hypothetical protein
MPLAPLLPIPELLEKFAGVEHPFSFSSQQRITASQSIRGDHVGGLWLVAGGGWQVAIGQPPSAISHQPLASSQLPAATSHCNKNPLSTR